MLLQLLKYSFYTEYVWNAFDVFTYFELNVDIFLCLCCEGDLLHKGPVCKGLQYKVKNGRFIQLIFLISLQFARFYELHKILHTHCV